MTVTMVVPCHNEADVIEQKIENLHALRYLAAALEIVIVDDGSTDGTSERVRRAAQRCGLTISLIEQPTRRGKAEALNRAVASSEGELIVLSDATAMWEVDALEHLVRPFGDAEVAVVSGSMRYRPTGTGSAVNFYWRYQDALRRWESACGSTVGVNGNVFAIRRVAFAPLPPGTVNDELTLALRAAVAGGRVVFEPRALAIDLPSPSMRHERKRRARMTAGRLASVFGPARGIWGRPLLAARFVSHKLTRPLLPIAGVAAIGSAVGVIARPRIGRRADQAVARLVLVAAAAVGALAVKGRLDERRGQASPALVRACHLVVSAASASVVGVVRAATGRQDWRWAKRPPEQISAVGPGQVSGDADRPAGRPARGEPQAPPPSPNG